MFVSLYEEERTGPNFDRVNIWHFQALLLIFLPPPPIFPSLQMKDYNEALCSKLSDIEILTWPPPLSCTYHDLFTALSWMQVEAVILVWVTQPDSSRVVADYSSIQTKAQREEVEFLSRQRELIIAIVKRKRRKRERSV